MSTIDVPSVPDARLRLPRDIADFFADRGSQFGCTNILDTHLPTTEQTIALVKNAMTVQHGISVAYDCLPYSKYLIDFTAQCSRPSFYCTDGQARLNEPGWVSAENGGEYLRHLRLLHTLERAELGRACRDAAANSVDVVHLFSPKQCNMACAGCYASAVPIDKEPYTYGEAEAYFERAKHVILQAKLMGAHSVHTSGDGEITVFPKFFDLLEFIESQGMQWLFFTAGLIFSSETAACAFWSDSACLTSRHIRDRIDNDIADLARRGDAKPVVRALLRELSRHRQSLNLYHSLWSVTARGNTKWRNPRFGDYDYVAVRSRDDVIELPSSLVEMMQIFRGEDRRRLGVEMPVSSASAGDAVRLAPFVVDNELKSYFEPVIVTGRAKRGMPTRRTAAKDGADVDPGPLTEPRAVDEISPLLVRSLCSFRFIHQPIVKVRREVADFGFFASPGTGVDLDDVNRIGVLESMRIGQHADGVFAAFHSPLIVNANFAYVTGCKCNDFSQRMLYDRDRLVDEWRNIAAILDTRGITHGSVFDRLQ